MKLFIIPSWYPTKLYPQSGTFFRERAHILHQSGIEIHVINSIIHPLRDIIKQSNISKNIHEFDNDFGFKTLQIETINQAPKYEAGAFKQHNKIWNKLFNYALDRYGVPDGVLIFSSIWAGTSLVETLKKMNIPMGVSEHMKEFMSPNGFTKKQLTGIRDTYSHASFILATSQPLLKKIQNQFPEYQEKMSIVPNPVDTDIFKPSLVQSKKPATPFQFIACGLFREEKEFPSLLDAFSQVSKNNECFLTLVGDGHQETLLRKKVDELNLNNRVSFLGYLSPKKFVEQLRESHSLVLSSSVETFGMVVIEAMSCGLPVVATRCGGPEFTISDKTGILVERNDVKSLANGMVQMLNQYKTFDSNQIREITLKRFSARTYAESINTLFTKN